MPPKRNQHCGKRNTTQALANFTFHSYTDSTNIFYCTFKSSDNDYLEDSYCDITVQGYGRRTSFLTTVSSTPTPLKPHTIVVAQGQMGPLEEEYRRKGLL